MCIKTLNMGGKPDKDKATFEEDEYVDQDNSVAHIDFLELHFGSAGLGAGAVIMIIVSALLIVCLFGVCFRIYHRYQRQRQDRRLFKHQMVPPHRHAEPIYENPIQMQNLGRPKPVHIPPPGAPLHRTTSAFDVYHPPSYVSRPPFVPPNEHHEHHEDERPPLKPQ